MSRAYSSGQDTTEVYRQKVTRKGVTIPSRWDPNPEPGKPYETVTYAGPYRTQNVGGKAWMNASDHTVKVEIQKLEAVPPGTLEWVTQKEQVLERDSSELG